MKIEDAIKFFKEMFVNMVELASRAVKGSETEQNAVTCMQSIETAIAALEKQIPKPPISPLTFGSIGICPVCSAAQFSERRYCYSCGQALKWSD